MFRVFHYLNEICKEQNFSRAAKNLYLSQPSLSLTIKKFEQDIGIQIFDRSTTPLQLTEAGQVYMDGVRQILAIEKDLETYLDDYVELKTGTLILGAPNMFASYFLPVLISQFLKQFPMIDIQLVEADFSTLYDMTLNGEIDLLLESHPFDETLFKSYPIFREHVLLAVPCSDPINDSLMDYGLSMKDIRSDKHIDPDWPCIPLQHFRNHRFLMMKKGYDMHTRAMRLFHHSGFEPRIFMSLRQLMTAYNMVNQQLGVSFVTDTTVKLSHTGDNIIFYKLDDRENERYVNLTHKLNRYISRSMREFIQMMGELSADDITPPSGSDSP